MRIKVESASIVEIKSDLLVVNLFEGVKKPGGAAAVVDKALEGQLSRMLVSKEFCGKSGEVSIVHTLGKLPADKVVLVGLGEQKEFDLDSARKAAAAAVNAARKLKVKRMASIVHGAGAGGLSLKEAAQATVEGSILGGYEFKGYKKEAGDEGRGTVDEMVVVEKDKAKTKNIQEGAAIGEVLANAQNRARDLVNAPANKATPTYLAHYAAKMAKEVGLECEILDPKKEKMEAIWSVAKGSKEPARVIVLRTRRPKAKGLIALIGKGVTFDAGGISLKPSKKLWEMKTDMAGAAAVIEAMRALAELRTKKDVIAVVPLTENMPDGGALKPGDVVSSLAGFTTEIISTDAEGRLILADAITYAKKEGAATLVDCATLTGGCVTALGDVASGLLANDDKLADGIQKAAASSGEKLWRLPLFEEYKEYLKSSIADQKNCTEGRGASPSIGAIFLAKFVGDTPWAHIDIAGTAYLSKSRGYLSEGATGIPIRTLVEFLKA